MGANTADLETGMTVSGVHVEELGGVIETERQRQAALSWIAYWKASVSAGGQSWLAGEQALGEIMQLRTRVNEYDKRVSSLEECHVGERGQGSGA